MKQPAVYIVSNPLRTVIYTGVTSNLPQRAYQHKNGIVEGFSSKYRCTDLIYYELTDTMESAITREKQIKAYRREKKMRLIHTLNPALKDLYSLLQ